MDLNTYQAAARKTASYPDVGRNPIYPTLGLTGEAGEVADKVKKVLRDRNGVFDESAREAIKLELGDVLWYIAQLSMELGYELEDVAAANLAKLSSRAARGRISGSGLNWQYDVTLDMVGSKMNVHFDDWIYRQSEDIAINRAYVSKFGIEIGSVTIVFLRGQAAAAVGPLDVEQWIVR